MADVIGRPVSDLFDEQKLLSLVESTIIETTRIRTGDIS